MSSGPAADDGEALVRSLRRPDCYPHPVGEIELVETHISRVFLTGDYAYKVKKPVDPGFLDFSTLELRRQACERELELNRYWTPELYLEVVPISGSAERPRVGADVSGDGAPFEYAVRMRQFPPDRRLDRVLEAGELTMPQARQIGALLAERHEAARRTDTDERWGAPETVAAQMLDNFAVLARAPRSGAVRRLEDWTRASLEAQHDALAARRHRGYVRDCHGDLHLSNLVALDDGIVAFDRIEFSDALRFIDVMSDAAFAAMDFMVRDRPDFAYAFLNEYLELGGDYEGAALLDFYLVYRSLVRAKVAQLSAEGATGPARTAAEGRCAAHIALAERLSRRGRAALVAMHGLSGSGKTWLSERLMTALPALRLRSDVERKRLHGLPRDADSGSELGEGLYGAEASRRTYERLAALARPLLDAGRTVIVDASFLERERREAFRRLAADCEASFVVVSAQAEPAVLRQRVRDRAASGSDASEAGLAVLEAQLAAETALGDDELGHAIAVDTGAEIDIENLLQRIRALTCRETESTG